MAFKRKFKKSFKKWAKKSFKKAKRTWKGKKSGPFRSKKSNIATSTETIDLGTFTAATDTGSTSATLTTTSLSQFARSSTVAYYYRFYRIAKVTYEYMPEANLYQAGLPTVPMVPRFISVMCRDGNFNGATAATAGTIGDLEQMGGKFRQFTKPVKISYVPNVCLVTDQLSPDGTTVATGGGYVTRKKSPWLSTITEGTGTSGGGPPASGVTWVHFGHQWQVVCDSFASGQIMGRIKVTAHFEYKLPLAALA